VKQHFHPDDLARFYDEKQRGVSAGAPFTIEARVLRRDGQYRWFLFLYKPFRSEQGEIVRWYATGTYIEDRKQAEWEFRKLVDAVPQHITVLAADGRRLYGNQVALDFHGCTLEEFLPEDLINQKVHPEDLARYWDTRKQGISTGIPFKTEARLLTKDAQHRWFLFLFNPLHDEQGHVVRWYATATDIEDRKQAERELQYERDRLSLLLELTNKLVSKLELLDLLHTVAESVHRIIQCDLVAVFLPNSKAAQLRSFVSAFPKKAGLIQLELADQGRRPIPIDGTLVGRVFSTGLEWTGSVSDLCQLGLDGEPGIAEDFKTGCVLPIVCCDRVLGALALARREENDFSKDDVDLLRSVASQVAIEVNNALIIEERRRAEDTLRRSEAYLAEAQMLSHTGSFAHDPVRGEITYWSQEAYRTFGFDPAKGPVTYQQAQSRVHPEDLKRFEEARERGIREKTGASVDFRVVPSGRLHQVCPLREPPLSRCIG